MKQPIFSIVKPDLEHMEEVLEDIRLQLEQGIATMPLFYLAMVPEGTPPANKAAAFAAEFLPIRKRLAEMGLPAGILVQCTIGHGYPLNAPSPFRKYVCLNNGTVEHICCPSDEDFCDHMRESMRTLAETHPDMILVDDDFRLIFRAGNGCACPWHMQRFHELTGTDMTREELFAHLKVHNTDALADAFVKTQEESILKAARAMREGIDLVDPTIPGGICGAGNNMESTVELAHILAGQGNPTVARISNGTYYPAGNRAFTKDFFRAATQMIHLKGKVDNILAEADTCPQNRYALGASWFHSHYVGTVLEGVAGAKRWITRLSSYEPESGKAYRKILAKNRGFYDALIDIVPNLEWFGCRIPLHPKKTYYFTDIGWDSQSDGADGWATHVLERLGLPLYFSAENTGVAFFSGMVDKKFTDGEMEELLRHKAVFASDVALRLQERGFGKHLGVTLAPWEGKSYSTDRILATGQTAAPQRGSLALTPIGDVEVYSLAQHSLDKKSYEDLFPTTTLYQNGLGGTACVFAGTPVTEYTYDQAFSFLTYSRKMQLAKMMRDMGEMPLYYTSDEEVYLKAARMKDGGLFAALFNLGYDVIEEMPFDVEGDVTSVSYLGADGKEHPLSFRREGAVVTVEKTALPMDPVILFFR